MKKLFVVLTALWLGSFGAITAQFDLQAIEFGVRFGLNVSGFGGDEKRSLPDSKAGFHIGVIADVPVLENVFFKPGVYITTKGAKDSKYKETANPTYLEIPFLGSYRIEMGNEAKLELNTGPYLAFGLAGKYKDKAPGSNYEEPLFKKDKSGNPAEFKRFDAGWSFGTGVTYCDIYVGISYEIGFVNYSNANNYSAKNKNFMLSLGYNF